MAAIDPLSVTLAALADPYRRAMLARLAGGERTVQELAAPLPLSPPSVTKHLKVLERAGLVERRRQAQFRPVKLRPEALKEVQQWLEGWRLIWDAGLDHEAEALEPQRNEATTAGQSGR